MKITRNILVKLQTSSARKMIAVLLLLAAQSAFAQFSITVTPTHETCNGNGAISIEVSGAAPGSDVTFFIYELPDTTTPFYEGENPVYPGLQSGTYLVVAEQDVNGNTVTAQEEVVIEDNTLPFVFEMNTSAEFCGDDGTISVFVTEGNATGYELLAGPVTRPEQESAIFTGLPTGSYAVRVYDDCGNAYVTTVVVPTASTGLNVAGLGFPDGALPACDLITAVVVVSPTDMQVGINYPLQAELTVTLPNGDIEVFTGTAPGGLPNYCEISFVIPFFPATPYYADVVVTDPCGVEYPVNDMLIDQELTAGFNLSDADCGMKFLQTTVRKFGSPYTIEFTNFTPFFPGDTFDPELFNEIYPGPFTTVSNDYGAIDMPVPWGDYEYTVYDSCGRVAESGVIEVHPPEEEPEVISDESNNDCVDGLGQSHIFVPKFDFASAVLVDFPEEYSTEEEVDVSGDIFLGDEGDPKYGQLFLIELPPGDYTIILIDDCGNEYPPYDFTVPEPVWGAPLGAVRPDCTEGLGSLAIASASPIIAVTLDSAPAEYEFYDDLPMDVMMHVTPGGQLGMDGLPPGPYSFTVDTSCQTDYLVNVMVVGYDEISSNADIERHCGSFDLTFSHESNSPSPTFGLQIYDELNGTWAHPLTLTPYTEGTPMAADNIPDTDENSTAIKVVNNQTLLSIMPQGDYRVLKQFGSYADGGTGSTNKTCFLTVATFSYIDEPQIVDIINLTCVGDIADIEVLAEGVEPLLFEIMSKDGDESFYINNGNDNVFPDLESAIYDVRITDPCGEIRNRVFNIADLPPLVNAYPVDAAAAGLERCDDGNDGVETFDLSALDSTILNNQTSTQVTLTYHLTESDALTGANPLPDEFVAETGTTGIVARVARIGDDTCFATTSFDIIVQPTPELTMQTVWGACEGEDVIIVADAGFDDYLWSTGAHTPSILVNETGIYAVTVTDEYGCSTTKEVEVVIASHPRIFEIEVSDWTSNNNVITVITEASENSGTFEYSIDGINYQSSNTFTGLVPGIYTVYVRSICGSDEAETYLLSYPKFFTPNGDGMNETWRIAYSFLEPDMQIYIFDRYGKLITGFGPSSIGWDGKLNGERLPATDYWFVVTRQNGKTYKGHFSLIR